MVKQEVLISNGLQVLSYLICQKMLSKNMYGMQMKPDISKTYVSCAVKTLTCAEEPVVVHDRVMDELKQLLLDFGAATDGDVCTAEEYNNIEAERWTEAPESDDNENPLAAMLEECEEPCGHM